MKYDYIAQKKLDIPVYTIFIYICIAVGDPIIKRGRVAIL
jgi:hypothetical protein